MSKGGQDLDADAGGALSLEERVRRWLEGEGYPLELQVGQVARALDWSVRHEAAYADPETKKVRAIDVLAMSQHSSTTGEFLSVSFTIECKRSDLPWVVMRSEAEFVRLCRAAPGRAFKLLVQGDVTPLGGDSELARECPRLLGRHRPPGHLTVRAFGKNDGDQLAARAALQSALTAATAFSASYEAGLQRDMQVFPFVLCHFPVVVIGGHLFEAVARGDGSLDVTQVPEALMAVPTDDRRSDGVLVPIVTAAHWPTVARELAGEAGRFARHVLPHFAETHRALREPPPIQDR